MGKIIHLQLKSNETEQLIFNRRILEAKEVSEEKLWIKHRGRDYRTSPACFPKVKLKLFFFEPRLKSDVSMTCRARVGDGLVILSPYGNGKTLDYSSNCRFQMNEPVKLIYSDVC